MRLLETYSLTNWLNKSVLYYKLWFSTAVLKPRFVLFTHFYSRKVTSVEIKYSAIRFWNIQTTTSRLCHLNYFEVLCKCFIIYACWLLSIKQLFCNFYTLLYDGVVSACRAAFLTEGESVTWLKWGKLISMMIWHCFS